jgi:hypothetical protein
MDKVQNFSILECYTQPPEPFRIYLRYSSSEIDFNHSKHQLFLHNISEPSSHFTRNALRPIFCRLRKHTVVVLYKYL